jgi:hypothetical protein
MYGKFWYDEVMGFLGINQIIEIFQKGNYNQLLTLDGILSVIFRFAANQLQNFYSFYFLFEMKKRY